MSQGVDGVVCGRDCQAKLDLYEARLDITWDIFQRTGADFAQAREIVREYWGRIDGE
jgi:hypothetical protein